MIDLGATSREVARLLPGVRDDQLAAPTPCPGYVLGDLLDHLDGLSLAFAAAAAAGGAAPPTGGSAPSGDGSRLGEGWRERIAGRLDGLAVAWRDPAAWSGTTRVGGVDLPGEVAGMVALNEVLVHGWDVASASGQRVAYDEEALEVSLAVVGEPRGPGDPGEDGGLFGPPVAVADDAPLLDRVIALSGRDPAWAPPR